jgi:fructose/tagatose bisphosphate aldolase
MALVSMRQLLDHAAENGYGVPAFNVNNLEQVQAIMEAAKEVNAPVIMQASAGARKYAGELFLKHLIQAAVESYPELPVAMHQDHGQSPAVCEGAMKLGFSSVMMDGSLREDGKFTRKPTGDILAIERIKEIHRRIPNTHLVMHGSSSVPQDLLAQIRKYGGDMKETYGVPVEEIQEAIKHGVRKINIDTDIRLAMTAAVRKYLFENPGKFDPRDFLKPAREAAKNICKQRYVQFGCEGQAGKIQPVPLSSVAHKYQTGELSQHVH